MQIENFKIFADLVETKSFSKAAKINGVTQSAVSQQTRSIERGLKSLLIDRSQKQFCLTREGQLFYDSAKDILGKFDLMLSEIQELKKIVSGTIRISTIYSIGLHELQPYVKRFLSGFPKVKFHVEYRRSNQVYEDVQHGIVDLGLVAFPLKTRQIEVLPFRDDRLVLITHPNHPFAKFCSIELKQMAGQKLIGFDPDIPTRKAIDQFFHEHKVDITPMMEFDNVETVKRAVEINSGVAIVPLASVQQEVRLGALSVVSFKDIEFTRPLAIIHRKGRVITPAIKEFIQILQREPLFAATPELPPQRITATA